MTLLRPKPPRSFHPDLLFRPESVAVIGAGTAAGAQIMRNIVAGRFQGAILPVDPALGAVAGVPACPTIEDLPVAPDLAVIASDGTAATEAIAALGRRGTHAAIVVGMAEGLRDAAARAGVRLLGPGSYGVSIPAIGLNASRAHLTPSPGRLAVVSQSAALCRAVLDWAEPNGIGFSCIMGIGGNADLGFAPVLDWLSRDPGTGAILLDIRLIRDRRRFLSAARAAARLRPVVAIRAGGRLLDPTGMADAALEAALRRCGILSVFRMEDLLAAAETLTRARPPRNARLVIVTNAIGPGQMAADAALRDGLELAELAPQTREALRASLPLHVNDATVPASPGVLYVGVDQPIRLAEVAAMLAGAPEIGGVLVVHAPTGAVDGAGIEALAACAKTIRIPLLVCVMGETTGAAHRRTLADAGIPAFVAPEQAVRGFLHLVQDRRNREAARELPPSTVLTVVPDRDRVRALFARARAEGRLDLAQDEALSVLAAYGTATIDSVAVAAADAAVAAARALGYPAVLKLRRAEQPSRAQVTGLALDLHDDDEVRAAYRALSARRTRIAPDAPDLGTLVQRHAARARELLVRLGDDALFGPVIAFGRGGDFAESVEDLALDLPPMNLPLAHALIARSRASTTLGAWRGLPRANEESVARVLVRVSQLVIDFPEIEALEINPLFADADHARAADAWIRLRAEAASPSRLAISPYPVEWIEQFDARGETLTIRPIRPEDAEAHGAFFSRLSPDDVRFRFFTAMRQLSAEQMARMTQVDYDREMAFVAVREGAAGATSETVGVARLVIEPGGLSGEFAVIVQPDMKGKGLASRLMRRLIDWARSRGVRDVVGQVLADNAPMLSFVRHLGFQITRLPGEDDVVEARLTLE